jgi:hypothetical protein
VARANRRNSNRTGGSDLEKRRLRVFAAWTKGTTPLALAAREGVSRAQISRDVAAVCATLAPPDWTDADKSRLELLGKLAYAESELLAAWERSKQPRERRRAKKVEGGASGAPGRQEGEKITEGRDGNPRFWERLQSLWELRSRLCGLIQNVISQELADQLGRLQKRARELGHDV